MSFTLLGILQSQASGGAKFPIEYLVVAGGGGGGPGGGGAGGYRTSVSGATSGRNTTAETPLDQVTGDELTVTVGAGGTWYTGGDSVFGSVTSLGGGRGTLYAYGPYPRNYGNGGAGGGKTPGYGPAGSGTAAQGFDGGSALDATSGANYIMTAGGGGGSSQNGETVTNNANGGGDGGDGLSSTITGSVVYYGGGGGGSGQNNADPQAFGGTGGGGNGGTGYAGQYSQGIPSTAGAANTGGGGGGARSEYGFKPGGSGIVIIRYPDTLPDITEIGAGLTYSASTSGGYKIYQFTAGTDTIIL